MRRYSKFKRTMFSFPNRSIPFFLKEQVILKPRDQWFIKIEALFIDKISELAIVKMLDKKAQNTMMLKLKFMWNLATLDVTNSPLETVIFDPKEILGILDLRSIGNYKIKQGILQQNPSTYYSFKPADILCEQFNKFINMLKKKKEETKHKYPLLDEGNEKRHMPDTKMLYKYGHLEKSCLLDSGKNHFMDMLYKYKDAFSLRDEIGTCPHIEVKIDVTDKSPFFIRPYYVKEEDKIYWIRKWKDYVT